MYRASAKAGPALYVRYRVGKYMYYCQAQWPPFSLSLQDINGIDVSKMSPLCLPTIQVIDIATQREHPGRKSVDRADGR